jgi:hypothetical protein
MHPLEALLATAEGADCGRKRGEEGRKRRKGGIIVIE